MYAGAAAAMAAMLFGVGTLVRPEVVQVRTSEQPVVGAPAPGVAETTAQDQAGAEPARREAIESKSQAGGGGAVPGTTEIAPVPPVPGPSRPGQFPPKIVRTANIDVEVGSFDRAWSRANAVATSFGGYVTSSQAGLERGTVTMRIPASKLDRALAELRKLGKLIQSTTTAEDVSAQIVDVDARLRTLDAEELQLLELLRKASGVSQELEVRDRLNAVRQEIESLEAQKEYFANQVDYATINANVFERGAGSPDEPPGDGVLYDAWRTAFRVGVTIVAGTVVVLGGLVPLAAIVLAAWAALRLVRRRRA
jgi:hypothetical protein